MIEQVISSFRAGAFRVGGSFAIACAVALFGALACSGSEASQELVEVEQLTSPLIENGPEGVGVERTLAPLRPQSTPDKAYIKRLREVFHEAGSFEHAIHFFQPDAAGTGMYLILEAQTMNDFVEPAHTFTNVVLISRPGEDDETQQTLPDTAGTQLYEIPTSREGWYELRFTYNAVHPERKMMFMGFGANGTTLYTHWVDPPGHTDLDVELKVMVTEPRHLFLKGGTYRNTSESEFAYVDDVELNLFPMYRRAFDQGRFNFPLGYAGAREHHLEFSLQASGSAKYWFGVNEQSFDPEEAATQWQPLQFLYQGTMRTGDYDAWNEGVAFAQGASLQPGVRPPPVRRGTSFALAVEHDALEWGDALFRIYPYGSGSETNWSQHKLQDYAGGIWNETQGGHLERHREHWALDVPSNAAVGRYVVKAFGPGGVKIGSDVLFYVTHDPRAHVVSGLLSEQELETFGYDEDEDGVNMYSDYGSDSDHWRDNFTANYSPQTAPPYTRRTKLTGAFRRTTDETPYSMLDFAVAASEGTTTEFETMRRLYRLLAQRVRYGRMDIRDDSTRILIIYGGEFTPDEAKMVASTPGYELPDDKRSQGECFDYATTLAAVARSVGIVSRSVSVSSLGGWGLHILTEAFIPTLPHHGGKQFPVPWAPNSDADHWYVFDTTDPNGDLGEYAPWTIYSEAISSRTQYGRATTAMFGDVTSVALTNAVDWDPFADFSVPASAVQDLTSVYREGPEHWLTSFSTTGWLGFGEKDVYRINRQWSGARRVRVRLLQGGNLVPKLCVVPSTGSPVLPDLCSNPSTNVELPWGNAHVVVFNDAPELNAYHGDSVQYVLELEY